MTDAIEPTPELATHHDITPSRRGVAAQIKSRVQSLKEAGAIDDAEFAACQRFRRDWDIGMEGASPGGAVRVRVDADNGGSALDRRIDAMSLLRAVRDCVLPGTWMLLAMCVAHDMSWTCIGGFCGTSDKTARRRCIEAIKALTEAYARLDARKTRRAA